MKYLSDYTKDAQTEIFERLGVFFAFSATQLEEGLRKYAHIATKDEYVGMGFGMCCPKKNAEAVTKELEAVNKAGIQKDIEENGKEGVITRELANYECFYTGNISEVIELMKEYGFTHDDVVQAYRKECDRRREAGEDDY